MIDAGGFMLNSYGTICTPRATQSFYRDWSGKLHFDWCHQIINHLSSFILKVSLAKNK
jgi:hypothetical protein